jgi:hypothetical protein
MNLRNSLIAALVTLAAVAARADAVTKDQLTAGSWQYGLVGDARSLPIGLAFQKGITATVLTLYPNQTLRMNIPCRNEEFIRQFGDFQIEGIWELKGANELILTITFRGQSRVESSRVEINGDELLLTSSGGEVRKLGRFNADLNAACTYK